MKRGRAELLQKGLQHTVHHRTAKLGSQICSPGPSAITKVARSKNPVKILLANKVLRWAFMMYHRIDDRALFFSWVPCLEAVQCTALNSNQYFEGVVLFRASLVSCKWTSS